MSRCVKARDPDAPVIADIILATVSGTACVADKRDNAASRDCLRDDTLCDNDTRAALSWLRVRAPEARRDLLPKE